jgi:hypothetical protein
MSENIALDVLADIVHKGPLFEAEVVRISGRSAALKTVVIVEYLLDAPRARERSSAHGAKRMQAGARASRVHCPLCETAHLHPSGVVDRRGS